jgi:hypothetical protein
MTSSCGPEIFGANPAIIKWQVVRGDTSPLRVEFYENDEVTNFSTIGWEYASFVYDAKGDALIELDTLAGDGYVDIIAYPVITELWGTGHAPVVAELAFDLQVTIDGETVWTPVIGTIVVLGDITGGLNANY